MDKNKFIKLLNVPMFAEPFLDYFVTDQDIVIVNTLENKAMTAEDVELKLNQLQIEELLEDAYTRRLLNKKVINNQVYYYISDFYTKVGLYDCLFNENFSMLPEETKEQIEKWQFSSYTEEMLPNLQYYAQGKDTNIGKPRETFFILDELEELLDKSDRFKVIPCNCRILKNDCDKPIEACLRFDSAIEDRTLGRELSREQTRELIIELDRQGLMHTLNADWRENGPKSMCNCCRCCCYPLRFAENHNTKDFYPVKHYVAQIDKQKCNDCGICIKRCHYNAFSRGNNKEIIYDPQKCWGCGLCKNSCPQQAIEIVRR